jgi:protein O-mannosyl-transferase
MSVSVANMRVPRTKKKWQPGASVAIADPPRPLSELFVWQAGALALLVFFAYSNSLTSGFHFDDSAIFANPWIMGSGFGWDIFRLDQTRPLTYLTFHWNYLADGQSPALYHLVNLLLHAANSILVLAIARRYVSPLAAAGVALVFALHPLQTESVTYVFARSTLLSTHLALWVIWCRNRGQFALSALLFGVSLLAKEETIALPAFLLVLDLFEAHRPVRGYFAALLAFAGMAAGHLFYLILISPVDPGVGRVRGISAGHYLLTQFRVIWIYLRLMVAPIGLNLERDVQVSTGLLIPWTTLAAVVALATLLAGLTWLAWKGRQPAAMWALGFFILIAPSSSIVAQADVIFEHRVYLPLVCAVIALGFVLERVPRGKLILTCVTLVPAMLAGTIARNADWFDEKTFWADAVAKSPNKGRAWLGLARAYPDDRVREREYLMRGLAVDPRNAALHNDYGISLLAAGDSAAALAHFQQVIALAGDTADGWNNIGGAYFRLNLPDASLTGFEKALSLDPCSFNARRNVMMIYSQRHDPHNVWLAGEVPADCAMLPGSAKELARLRLQAGNP